MAFKPKKEFDNTNKGAFWATTDKDKERYRQKVSKGTPPVGKGSINVDGREYWADLYRNDSDSPNSPHFNVTVKLKDERESATAPRKEAPPIAEDDIPF